MNLERLKQVQMVLLDVDGVLTAGEIIYGDSGEQFKIFNAKDGVGIRMLKAAGIHVGIVTGRSGEALRHRCTNLGIDLLFDAVRNKVQALDQILARTGLTAAATAFVGDDLPDLAIMKKVGLAVAVADAHEAVRDVAHLITRANGGRGAVREVCDTILKAQGRWDELVQKLFHG
ncbi:MAG: HAD-IIIA family hydrolase [Desulfatitalea sp.]|nr:HAD-IIIA family hydrolase [Desulfatitalea sp.]MBI5895343.1 HAD-IIIA family hydrolase [Desulfobacterales bacterium]